MHEFVIGLIGKPCATLLIGFKQAMCCDRTLRYVPENQMRNGMRYETELDSAEN